MSQKIVIGIIFFMLVSALPIPADAASFVAGDENSLEQGKQAYRSQDYNAAVHYFQMAFIDDPANLEISYYLGLAASEVGDYETAIMSFERILIMQPESMRIKLELARSHMRLGLFEFAKQYFYEVLASNPPQSVRANIENLLSSIAAAERRHFFSGTITAGIGFDDNIRSAPGDFLFTFPGAVGNVTLDISVPPQSDYYTTASMVLNHIYRKEGSSLSWKTTAMTFNNLYGEYHDQDVNLIGISTGPVYEAPHALFEVHGIFHELRVEHEGYMRPMGIGGSAIISLDPKLLVSAATTFQEKRYVEDINSVKDAANLSIGISPVWLLGDNRIAASLSHEKERAEANYWSYGRLSWGLRYDRVLPLDFTAFAGFNRQKTEYDAIMPGETNQRLDTVSDLYCGLTKLLWQSKSKRQNLLGQLSHTYTDSDSNVPTYNYRKNVSVAMFSYGF